MSTYRNSEVVHGLAEHAYHDDTSTLSASAAKVLLGTRPPTCSAALDFGTLAHVALLEPERLDTYAVLRPPNGEYWAKGDGTPASEGGITRTREYIDAAVKAKRDGLTAVSAEDWDKAQAIVEAVREHPKAGELVSNAADREVSIYADHPSGARVRGRLDLVGSGYVADLKTCQDGNPDTFGRTAYRYGYHISAGHYLDLAKAAGHDVECFYFIAVEKEQTPGGNYRVSVMFLDDLAIEQGRRDFSEACRRWLALGRVDLPDYPDDEVCVSLPGYAYDELEVI